MIDLHNHILPGIDDGSRSLEMSIEMARIAVDDGIRTIACTPHIYPGLYMNDTAGIRAAVDALQAQLHDRGIPLTLTFGADIHLVPGLVEEIRGGRAPTLHGSRYVLLEPPHHVAPPQFAESVFRLLAEGWVPVITHPERLTWIETHFEVFRSLVRSGAWMQVTAGALTGGFGSRPRYWAEKFLAEGLTHILATDAHSSGRRIPVLGPAREAARKILGEEEAERLVAGRPQLVLEDRKPDELPLPSVQASADRSWWKRALPRFSDKRR